MARRVGADAAQTRRALLASAAAQFAEHGIEATSLRTVAKDAGVSLATIHYYYGNKQSLYDACFEGLYDAFATDLQPLGRMFAQLASRIEASSSSSSDLQRVTDEVVRMAFRSVRAHRPVLRLIMRHLLDSGELPEDWRDQTLLPFSNSVARLATNILERDVPQLRFDVQSVIALVMRWSLSSPEELARFLAWPKTRTRLGKKQCQEIAAATEDRLVQVCQRILFGGFQDA